MSVISDAELRVYRRRVAVKDDSVRLLGDRSAHLIMKRSRKSAIKALEKLRPNYVKRMISLQKEIMEKAIARANLLFPRPKNFSLYISWLIAEDYKKDERVIMQVSPDTPEYRAFRESHPGK